MEIALKRLDGVTQVAISMERQAFVVTYQPGATFQPQSLRDAVAVAHVTVVRFQIQARGRVQMEGAKPFFVAGKNRFLLVNSPQMPADQLLQVGGEIGKDSAAPIELKVLDFKPL